MKRRLLAAAAVASVGALAATGGADMAPGANVGAAVAHMLAPQIDYCDGPGEQQFGGVCIPKGHPLPPPPPLPPWPTPVPLGGSGSLATATAL